MQIKPLLLSFVQNMPENLTQKAGNQLFLSGSFKAARIFYQRAKNFKALNHCCLRVSDFAGELRASAQLNEVPMLTEMLDCTQTRIFGIANLLYCER